MREAGVKEKGALKTARLKFFPKQKLAKPDWIRVRAPMPGSRFHEIKQILREQRLHTVCEEASCPNIAECFGNGTATFMILGDICTRRGRLERALEALSAAPPDVMNHNMETVPRLYRHARPGGDYAHSLELFSSFARRNPQAPTKSGLMVGLGETDEEILAVMRDLRARGVAMLTIGQYLAPSAHHLPVERYVHPDIFAMFEREAQAMGFRHAAIGPLVRSSYHADRQAQGAGLR